MCESPHDQRTLSLAILKLYPPGFFSSIETNCNPVVRLVTLYSGCIGIMLDAIAVINTRQVSPILP
jgi:hypothetical protein